jgi:glycosyltransferase involved in cell wall biosynthesis
VSAAIHQFVPRLEPGAVGAHVLQLQALAEEVSGRPSAVFVGTASPGLAARARPFRDYGRKLPANREDVLVYQSAIGSPVADFLLRRRQVIVVNFHNLTPVRYLRAWDVEAADGVLWGERQLRQLAPRASLAIADSTFNADHLRGAGYRDAAVAVAPVLVDLEALVAAADAGADARLAAAKAAGGSDWLFVGRVSANKCQHRLVGALAAYRRLYDPHARLWLVGGGDQSTYGKAVNDLAAKLGLGDAVTLTGPVAPATLAAHYRQADVFVCLSEHEGYCVPLVEAMRFGVPVVAAGSSAIPETAQGGAVVLPFPGPRGPGVGVVAAAVHRVLGDPSLRDELVAAGRQRAEQLSLPATRERYRALLQGIVRDE